ncbi:MAG: hypothetical protein KKA16_11590 [Alphaproteobacteria bacterium]|nr:hypothetical protein [Alphaproteobacteria bacterium]MBU2380939.1 hypothetical protein [Alphaproteobacteria bacterium]
MRRFLIWSALAVVIGLALAGGGYWAYWNFYARFQPITITRNQAEIQRLLDEASWVSGGGGGEPLYIIGYRDSASTQRYEQEESEKLRAAGVEPRVIVFARPDREGQPQSTPAERATVAELWLSRDWTLHQRWTATPSRNWTAAGVPAADGNLARSAVVEASRLFVTRLRELMRDAGAPSGYPLVIWRDGEGFMKACACADARSWAFIRDDFDAPDAVAPPGGPEGGVVGPAPLPEPVPGDGSPDSLPYPNLPIIPPVEGAPAQPGVTTAPGSPATERPAPTRPARPTAPPEPSKSDDTTFF